jgi:hypothetical protein
MKICTKKLVELLLVLKEACRAFFCKVELTWKRTCGTFLRTKRSSMGVQAKNIAEENLLSFF